MKGLQLDIIFCHTSSDCWKRQAEAKVFEFTRLAAQEFTRIPRIFIAKHGKAWYIRASGTNSRKLQRLVQQKNL